MTHTAIDPDQSTSPFASYFHVHTAYKKNSVRKIPLGTSAEFLGNFFSSASEFFSGYFSEIPPDFSRSSFIIPQEVPPGVLRKLLFLFLGYFFRSSSKFSNFPRIQECPENSSMSFPEIYAEFLGNSSRSLSIILPRDPR